jgi:hypothetical protein
MLSVGTFEPDKLDLDGSTSRLIRNVLPKGNSYGPMAGPSIYGTSTLPAQCVGLAFARTNSGGWLVFAGTKTKLYKLVSDAWVDYSRTVGGNYNVPDGEFWSVCQFGSQLIACNFNDDPQVIDVDSAATAFSPSAVRLPRPASSRQRRASSVWSGWRPIPTGTAGRIWKTPPPGPSARARPAVGSAVFPDRRPGDECHGRLYRVCLAGAGASRRSSSCRALSTSGNTPRSKERAAAWLRTRSPLSARPRSTSQRTGFIPSTCRPGLKPIGATRVNNWWRDNTDASRRPSVMAVADPVAPRIYWIGYSTPGVTVSMSAWSTIGSSTSGPSSEPPPRPLPPSPRPARAWKT